MDITLVVLVFYQSGHGCSYLDMFLISWCGYRQELIVTVTSHIDKI
ncbi:hypothetical protein DCAR_0311474 [Daucus carota subsp. sativus]|uniref:Uncharacterized protein n=1 Tax=Daucus carota subsp. sativus TaxID=79200 RepID=A0AAF0WLN2_DAUCS|nr:hypothetical protein DCAR_0311474 [Daucus carota subsp. sativus]